MPPDRLSESKRKQRLQQRRNVDKQRKRQVRSELTEEEQAAARAEDAARRREARARQRDAEISQELTVPPRQPRSTRTRPAQEDREEARASSAEQRRRARSRVTEAEAAEVRSRNAAQHREARAQLSEAEAAELRSLNAAQHREVRAQLSEAEAAELRSLNAAQRREHRARLSEAEAAELRSLNAAQHREARAQLSRAEVARLRSENTVQHQRSRTSRNIARLRKTTSIARRIDQRPEDVHNIGRMNDVCSGCRAAHFKDERATSHRGAFSMCCATDRVRMQIFENFPAALCNLYTGQDEDSRNFRQHIRNYNSALAMASMVATIETPPGHGPYCFRVHGQVYHTIGGLRPQAGEAPRFAQILIMDTGEAAQELAGRTVNRDCQEHTFALLHELLKTINPYARAFKMMSEVSDAEAQRARSEGRDSRPVRMVFEQNPSEDQRRCNAATANEVAVVYVGDDDQIPGERLLVIHEISGGLRNISYLDKRCDPLTYPLLFPQGEDGWHPDMERQNPTSSRRSRVTQKDYYSFLLFSRGGIFNPLHHAGKLLQQFMVDSWLKIEMNRLNYIRQHQSELRLDAAQALEDYMVADDDESGPPGRRIVLAATFTGGPRYMVAQYQDAMTIVSKYGKPDLFVTFTCNPSWPEISTNLEQGQTASDRPDLVARVFQLKVKALCHEVVKDQVLGEVAAYIYVIEFQKRGLPHMHMLLTLKAGSKLTTAAEVDSLISAELPDPLTEPALYRIVSTSMIHRPCGVQNPNSPCMKNNECSKRYPKTFRDETSSSVDGYPEYRRRDDGRSVMCRDTRMDNRSVVPYCPYLSMLFNAHINVEVCALIHAVKYLYKYVYKGADRARIRLHRTESTEGEERDEINSYWDTRYVCAPEAAHRIFGFAMSDRSDAVQRLQVHLPNFNTVRFRLGEEADALRNARERPSTLTAFFAKNLEMQELEAELGILPANVVDSRKLRYNEMPEKYTFANKWKLRKQLHTRTIGRMYFVSAQDHERFALRLLLLYGAGFTSFEDVRTVDGRTYPSFVAAARAAGYLRDTFRDSLGEAAGLNMPPQFRSFFAALMVFGELQAPIPVDLWNEFKEYFMEDFIHRGMSYAESESRAFHDIALQLADLGKDIREFLPLDVPVLGGDVSPVDFEDHRARGTEKYRLLNEEQKLIVDEVLGSVGNPNGQCYFIDGPGGSGKTFVHTTIYHLAISRGLTVINVAWTGIAANLLPDGRTVTSTFRLVVQDNSRSSSMNGQSQEAANLRATDIIIWDEAPIAPRTSLETIDALLWDVMQNTKPSGGKIMLLGGDFRQILPVVERGTRGQIVDACLKHSPLWRYFRNLKLRQNMRVSDEDALFRDWLLEIGDGKLGPIVDVPEDMTARENLAETVSADAWVENTDVDLADMAILTPKNAEALKVNELILEKLPGESVLFRSEDEALVEDPSDALNFPTEFLNRMTPASLPPHELHLKKGCIVMLLRNLNVRKGLCNGTRLIVTELLRRVVVCKFATGAFKDTPVLIPRIDCYYSHQTLPFRLRRRQFPIRLSFCMTINKSQGQSFTRVGIELKEPIFSHGQLYVALSRARSRAGIFISSPDGRMQNIVYDEVLR